MSQIRTKLDWARAYVEKGFSVIPPRNSERAFTFQFVTYCNI